MKDLRQLREENAKRGVGDKLGARNGDPFMIPWCPNYALRDGSPGPLARKVVLPSGEEV